MKHIYIKNPIIENPQTDCVYHLSYHSGEVLIQFSGMKTVKYLDVSITMMKITLDPLLWWYNTTGTAIFFPRDILPFSRERSTLSPIITWVRTQGFFTISEYRHNLDTYHLDMKVEHTTIPQCINETLEKRFKNVFNIPVSCGVFPIFHEDKRPTHKFIASLYALFMRFNDKSKREFQYQNSIGLCHIRAHFISQFLQMYFNIPTMKLFKYWYVSDWQAFAVNKSWRYHAATVIMDNKSRLWVWDPWVGDNAVLLTMKQWLYRKDEPTPTRAMLANSHIIMDHIQGRRPDGLMFRGRMDILSAANDTAYQAVSGSVLVNAPERPIASTRQMVSGIKKHGLFALTSVDEQVSHPFKVKGCYKSDLPSSALSGTFSRQREKDLSGWLQEKLENLSPASGR